MVVRRTFLSPCELLMTVQWASVFSCVFASASTLHLGPHADFKPDVLMLLNPPRSSVGEE